MTNDEPPENLFRELVIQKECLTKQFAIDLAISVPEKPTVEWLFANEFSIV